MAATQQAWSLLANAANTHIERRPPGVSGIYVSGAEARGRMTNNDVYENKDGVVIREGGAPSLDHNRIRDQTRRGVLVCAGGQGAIIENEVSGSASVKIKRRSCPSVSQAAALTGAFITCRWRGQRGGPRRDPRGAEPRGGRQRAKREEESVRGDGHAGAALERGRHHPWLAHR